MPSHTAETRQEVARHTAGEWRADGHYVFDSKGNCIVITDTDNAEAERFIANARLCAAAPDLLAALRHLLTTMSVTDEEGLLEFAEPVATARAAIAKAVL